MALWKVRSTTLRKKGFTIANIYPLQTELDPFHPYNHWLYPYSWANFPPPPPPPRKEDSLKLISILSWQNCNLSIWYNHWLASCWKWLSASINNKCSPVVGPVMFPVKESLKAPSSPFRSALRRSALPCLLKAFNVFFSFLGDMSSAPLVENNRQGRTSKT